MGDALRPLSEFISLEGRRAIVTGAASGIGRAIALRFAEAGADLVLVDVDMEGLRSLEAEMKGDSGLELHRVDLSDKTEIDRFWESLEGGPPDILVNNAGIYPFKDFLEIDEAFLGRVMDTNLNSVLWMSQHMIRRRIDHGGVIIISHHADFTDALCTEKWLVKDGVVTVEGQAHETKIYDNKVFKKQVLDSEKAKVKADKSGAKSGNTNKTKEAVEQVKNPRTFEFLSKVEVRRFSKLAAVAGISLKEYVGKITKDSPEWNMLSSKINI